MFDLSMVELGVIALVALLVLGPERLPKAARTLGFYVRKARQSWYSVRAEFERELAAEELRRSLKLDEVHATLQDTARAARDGLQISDDSKPASADPATPDRVQVPDAQSVDENEDGLSAEERARQCEPITPESDVEERGLEQIEPADRGAGESPSAHAETSDAAGSKPQSAGTECSSPSPGPEPKP